MLVQDGTLEKLVQKRYESFTSGLGAKIEVSCVYLSFECRLSRRGSMLLMLGCHGSEAGRRFGTLMAPWIPNPWLSY
jgi:hypothetical protein